MSDTYEDVGVETADDGYDGAGGADDLESIDMGADGQLEFKFREDEVDEEAAPEAEASASVPSTEEQPEAHAQPDPWEKRAKDAQAWATRAAQENARLREQMAYLQGQRESAPRRQPEQPEIDPLDLMSDPAKFRSFVNEQIEAGVQERLRPYEPHFAELELRAELQEVVNKYGDEFIRMQPQLSRVFQHFAARQQDISFEDAFLLARQLGPPAEAPVAAGQPAQRTPAPAAAAPPGRRVPLQDLQRRAARVTPETGIAGASVAEVRPEPRTRREAFEQALLELNAGRR